MNGVGILERMRAVLAEEPAAVGAELLDGDLRRRRAERDDLVSALDRLGGHVRREILHHALADQHDGERRLTTAAARTASRG